ncbi:MAG: hypothetical protein HKN12_09955, partial [Gemmatimonadetes bacterium]|nr:hypothetical protein [Gemmatimonadota bacterium]
GYAQVPVSGDRLRAAGVGAVAMNYRLRGGSVDLEMVNARTSYRAALPPADDWTDITLSFGELRDTSPPGGPPEETVAWRFLRFAAPRRGLEAPVQLDVRSLRFVPTREPEAASGAAAAPGSATGTGAPPATATPVTAPANIPDQGSAVQAGRLYADGAPFFPFGVYLMGGNRSLMEELGEHGANTTVEYGPAVWPVPSVEDWLDYARVAGVMVMPALTVEKHDRAVIADERLVLLHRHAALLGWYIADEPDGMAIRRVHPEVCKPGNLVERREWLGEQPVLVTCLNPFGLQRYARAGDMLSTDFYWPAYGPDRSAAVVYSDAESVVEIAAEQGALPVLALQLEDPKWRDPGEVTTPEAMRAQAIAALAAGIRGLLFFQGAQAVRIHDRGGEHEDLWPGFLELAEEISTVGPLAARWRPRTGLELTPAAGEVRAACFEEGGERWVVVVNLGQGDAAVRLAGPALDGARALTDPYSGWRGEVQDGAWTGTLAPFEGHVARVDTGDRPVRRVVAESVLQPPDGAAGRRTVYYDRAVLGATLYPSPEGEVSLELDGEDVTLTSRIYRGAATVVRHRAANLSHGPHEAVLHWEDGGKARRERWLFQVKRIGLPFTDTFDRTVLGDAWARVRDVPWNHFDPEEPVVQGSATLTDGDLHIRSERGAMGVILRKFEAPVEFAMGFHVRLAEPGAVLIQRNELFREVKLPAGRHLVVFRETPTEQRVFVDDRPVAEWHPERDHRGGGLAIGVPDGGEAWFEDFRLELP